MKLHQFLLTSVPALYDGYLYIAGTGQRSEPFCLSVQSMNVFAGANDSFWVTFVALNNDNQAALIMEPVVPSTVGGVPQPATAIVLSPQAPEACFTVRFDVNFPDLYEIEYNSAWTITAYHSGPNAKGIVSPISTVQFPQVKLDYPETYVTFFDSALTGADGVYLAGESFDIIVGITRLPLLGFTYNVTFTGATVVPVDAAAGTFSPDGVLQHLWRVTVFTYPVREDSNDMDGNDPKQSRYAYWQLNLQGPGAFYYNSDYGYVKIDPRYFTASTRIMSSEIGFTCGEASAQAVDPVIERLVIRPRVNSIDARLQSAITFTPEALVLTPSDRQAHVSWTSHVLGDFEVSWYVDSESGSDGPLFLLVTGKDNDRVPLESLTLPLTIRRRLPPSITIDHPAGGVEPGRTYSVFASRALEVEGFEMLLAPGDNFSLRINGGADLVFEPSVFTWTFGSAAPHGTVTFLPAQAGPESSSLVYFLSLEGPSAWMYEPIEERVELSKRLLELRLGLPLMPIVSGVRYTGYAVMDSPSPVDVTVTLLSTHVQFFLPGSDTPTVLLTIEAESATTTHFEFIATAPLGIAGMQIADPNTYFSARVLYLVSPETYFYPREVQDLTVAHRAFQFDTSNVQDGLLRNFVTKSAFPRTTSEPALPTFMLHRTSPLYTITLVTGASAASVSLTLSHPDMEFSPATMTFAPGQLTASFEFTPIRVPSSGSIARQLSISVTGAEADQYDYSDLVSHLHNIRIIPELGFSPLPTMGLKETVTDLRVWLVDLDAATAALSANEHTSFTLHPVINNEEYSYNSVQFVPSVLEFTPQSLAGNVLSQSFSIVHSNLVGFNTPQEYYNVWWILRYQSSSVDVGGDLTGSYVDITQWVPLDAQRVTLRRHQIIPTFPKRLEFNTWQHGSFNLTMQPTAALTLTPHVPMSDGQRFGIYGGAHTPGGQVRFDPPEIVFTAGQMVADFKVMPISGSDQRFVYYRVDWEISGHYYDLYCFYDYMYPRDGAAKGTHFSTWHVAAASLPQLTLAVAMLALACVLVF